MVRCNITPKATRKKENSYNARDKDEDGNKFKK